MRCRPRGFVGQQLLGYLQHTCLSLSCVSYCWVLFPSMRDMQAGICKRDGSAGRRENSEINSEIPWLPPVSQPALLPDLQSREFKQQRAPVNF